MKFITYLKEKRKYHFCFLVTAILLNLLALNQHIYAFNLLSVFIVSFWFIILKADMDRIQK